MFYFNFLAPSTGAADAYENSALHQYIQTEIKYKLSAIEEKMNELTGSLQTSDRSRFQTLIGILLNDGTLNERIKRYLMVVLTWSKPNVFVKLQAKCVPYSEQINTYIRRIIASRVGTAERTRTEQIEEINKRIDYTLKKMHEATTDPECIDELSRNRNSAETKSSAVKKPALPVRKPSLSVRTKAKILFIANSVKRRIATSEIENKPKSPVENDSRRK